MGFIPAPVTDSLPNPEHFVLLLFPFAYLVPCGCFGEGAAACCRTEGAQCCHYTATHNNSREGYWILSFILSHLEWIIWTRTVQWNAGLILSSPLAVYIDSIYLYCHSFSFMWCRGESAPCYKLPRDFWGQDLLFTTCRKLLYSFRKCCFQQHMQLCHPSLHSSIHAASWGAGHFLAILCPSLKNNYICQDKMFLFVTSLQTKLFFRI